MTVPLLGFDRPRWERRKAELRIRLAKQLASSPHTLKNREQIESENLVYWTSGGMNYLRRKFMIEAEQARGRWAKLDPQGPNGVARRRIIPKCDTSEGEDSGTLKCDIKEGQIRVCGICGNSFRSTRSDASLCSVRCRKKANRASRVNHRGAGL
jgi:hypothetical protein